VKYHRSPNWTDVETGEIEPRSRLIEEQVELRRHQKQLKDCELPMGFRLLTSEPKQFWMGWQLVWGFKLGWGPSDAQGNLLFGVKHTHTARYEQRIADEPQMRWALEDFTRELEAKGVRLGNVSDFLPTVQSTRLRNVATPVLQFLRRAS